MPSKRRRARARTAGSFSWTIDDILNRFAEQAFGQISEGLGIRFCPRDHVPMVKFPSGFYYCPTCEGKFAVAEPGRTTRTWESMGDAFRPFDPFNPRGRNGGSGRRADRWWEGTPPQPHTRERPEPRHVAIDPLSEAYKELGMSPPVTKAAVKARRRELAKQYHPDIGGDGKKLARINAAADLLLEML